MVSAAGVNPQIPARMSILKIDAFTSRDNNNDENHVISLFLLNNKSGKFVDSGRFYFACNSPIV